jgi:hypothetical protein
MEFSILNALFLAANLFFSNFLCIVCGYRSSESSVKVYIAGKVGEMSHAGDDNYEVGVASRNTSNKKVYDSLPFVLGEDISSHDTSIVERVLYDFPFCNRS